MQLDIEVTEVGRDPCIALVFDLLGFQHVLLIREKGTLGGRVRCHEGRCEGGSSFPGGVARGVIGYWAGGIGIRGGAGFGENSGAWSGGVVVGVG